MPSPPPTRPPADGLSDQIAAFRSRLNPKSLILLALWALFMLWTGWGTLTNSVDGLFSPSRPTNPYAVNLNLAASLFDLNLWAFLAGLVFALAVLNPGGWLNIKRLAFASMAFAMMLGRLITGFAAGPLAYLQTINTFLAFVAVPILLLLGGAIAILVFASFISAVFGFLVGIPTLIANQVFAFERSLQIYGFKANSLAGRIARLVLWLRNEQPPEAAPDDSKGARFATLGEIDALHVPEDPAAMAFGHIVAPLFIKTDKHVLIMASTRSGKGVTVIIPHLLRYHGSAFVLDPKGENAKATIRTRRTLNNKVHVLDPFGITGLPQARFNPLTRFTPDNMEAESKALAAAMFVTGDREQNHWNASGQQLLAALILFVYVSPDIPPESKDLPMVRRLLLGGLEKALDDMIDLDAADGLLRDLATSFQRTPKPEFGSILSTAQRQTEILDNPYMIACLSASGPGEEVDFKAWHRGTMTVYLCLSAPRFPTFNRWLRLILTSALDEMTDTLDPPKLPVCFMLDEIATLGHLATVENAVGLAAGYGIQLVIVFQDVAQMKDLYKSRWASFIGNAGVRVLFNLDDFDSAEYWSKFIGKHLVESRSHQQDNYGFSKGENVSENMRPLIAPEELMMQFASNNNPDRPDKMLVLAQGAHPIKTDRVAYFADQGLVGLWDDPRRPLSGPRPPPYRPLHVSIPQPPVATGAPDDEFADDGDDAHEDDDEFFADPVQPSTSPAVKPTSAPTTADVFAGLFANDAAPAVKPASAPATAPFFGSLFAKGAAPPSAKSPDEPPTQPETMQWSEDRDGLRYDENWGWEKVEGTDDAIGGDAPLASAQPKPIVKFVPIPPRPKNSKGRPSKR